MDLLGWAGCLKVAEGSVVLEAFLSGRRTHKNIAMGIQTANKLLHLDSTKSWNFYFVLSNIYAEARRWDSVY